ncbi:MAG: TonB-dependent receptor [Bacteroidales bacterium]|nr:TonB-dependent receptor [Bacteroidales bacterium]
MKLFKATITLVVLTLWWSTSIKAQSSLPDSVAFSLSLTDVVVTAKPVNGVSNIQKLNQTAIQHQQTSSVADLMQLLPGVLTSNPNLNKQNQIVIRDTKDSNANKNGVAIITDGMELSNDANLQLLSTNVNNTAETNESALKGTDLRPISTDAIESMTVIRGVAPAEYGNLTSGAVIINYNNRPRPLTVVVKTDPKLKSISGEYGKGHINANLDYAISQKDERSTTEKFQRIGLRLAFHRLFGIVFLNSVANGHYASNIYKTDPDLSGFQKETHTDKSLSLSNSIKIRPHTAFLPSITIDASGRIQWQEDDTNEKHIANMPTPYTDVVVSGTAPGKFYPVNYNSSTFIHGKPVSGQIKVLLKKAQGSEERMNTISLGAHLNLQRNFGEGKGGTYMNPYVRSRKFRDIPHLGSSAFFIDDKFSILGLQGQLGLRMTHINAPQYDFKWQFEPRLSAKYSFCKNLSISASWGIMKKLPSLIYLYPDPYYEDYQVSAYTDENGEKHCSFTTYVVNDNKNYNLKLPTTNNYEITLDAKSRIATFTLTYFNEHLTGGYDFKTRVTPFRVETAAPDTTFAKFRTPRNNVEHEKWGIEYVVDFAKIEPLNLSIYVDGAYQQIIRTDTETEQIYDKSSFNGRLRSIAAEVLNANSWNNISESARFNTNVRFIVHIPDFGLVASVKTQGVWMDKTRNKAEYKNMDMAYVNASDGRINIDPVNFISKDGVTIPYDKNIAQGQKYIHYTTSTALKSDDPKPYGQVDIKISKEIAKRTQLSLYVNNITNYRPKRHLASSNVNIYTNQATYFGCDLRIKI